MRKRERKNPCGICGHYHKYEEGEGTPARHRSAFPTEVLRISSSSGATTPPPAPRSSIFSASPTSSTFSARAPGVRGEAFWTQC